MATKKILTDLEIGGTTEATSFIKTNGTSSQYLMADGTTSTGPSGGVDVGTGTANKVAKFSDSDTITDSTITDDGTDVSITGTFTAPEIVGSLTRESTASGRKFIVSPENGYLAQNTSSSTGYLIIETPAIVGNNYSAFNINLEIGGQYNSPMQMYISSQWLTSNFSNSRNYAYSISEELTNYPIRWGSDGTNSYIIIGESDTSWSRRTFAIKSVSTNYIYNDTDAFTTNWDISINSDISSITIIDTQSDVDLMSKTGVKRILDQTFTGSSWNTIATLDFGTTTESSGVIKVLRLGQGHFSFSFSANDYGKRTLKLEPGSAFNSSVYTGVRITDDDKIQLYVGTYANATSSIIIEGYRLNGTTLVSEVATGTETSLLEITDVDADEWGEVHAQEFKVNDKITAEDLYISTGGVGVGVDNPTEKLEVDGNAKADSFIKDGGTAAQFLKADGSVDSSTYSTTDTQLTTEEVQDIVGAMVSSNTEQSISVTYSDGDGKLNFDAGAAVYEHPGETAFTAAVDTGALTGAVVVSDIDMNISTNAFGHVTSTGMAVATRTLTLADLGFTGDVDATNDQVLPTDFVSAAGGGTFNGDIVADAFIVAGGSSNRFLKGDGSLDASTYVTGAGTSGNIAFYIGTNEISDTSKLAWDAITDTLDVEGDIDVTDDVNVTGNVDCNIIAAEGWSYIPQTFQANFVHSSGNGYMNVPFNSLSDTTTGGEQHFLVTPYQGYVYSVAFKNTATGNAMTGTNMNFRVLRNGSAIYTSGSQTFTAAARTYKGWVLGSTDATFFAGNDLRFQFRCTSGFWQDTCAVVVLKCII